MSSRPLRSVPSGLGENAVADRKVRSRRRRPEGIGRARGLGVPGASRPTPSAGGLHRGTQVTQWTRVGQYARLWWESQGTRADRRGVLDVGRVR